jgi:fumarate hydratase class I
VAPLTMFEEANTGTNLPAQIDIFATKGDEVNLLFFSTQHFRTSSLLSPLFCDLTSFSLSSFSFLLFLPLSQYHFQFIAKGGGSANKTFLFQQTKALLNPESLVKFLNGNFSSSFSLFFSPFSFSLSPPSHFF